ncbi:hypothetical protein B0T25DRAFT_97041 [Lasiosphaeria hispida]|uniref:Uncharacterized protein n=1 Tax=Lasiosphaeria hispida TaxID=260671 RepID=A0AAJ0HQ66_9PEZI|nr:hypothetical protein B0T25DRAFT_97041 [Lasiosphaeria hispida]
MLWAGPHRWVSAPIQGSHPIPPSSVPAAGSVPAGLERRQGTGHETQSRAQSKRARRPTRPQPQDVAGRQAQNETAVLPAGLGDTLGEGGGGETGVQQVIGIGLDTCPWCRLSTSSCHPLASALFKKAKVRKLGMGTLSNKNGCWPQQECTPPHPPQECLTFSCRLLVMEWDMCWGVALQIGSRPCPPWFWQARGGGGRGGPQTDRASHSSHLYHHCTCL